MKHFPMVIFAFVIGLLIGGWGPRSDLKRTKDEMRKTEKLLRETTRRPGGIDGVTHLLGIQKENTGYSSGTSSNTAGSASASTQNQTNQTLTSGNADYSSTNDASAENAGDEKEVKPEPVQPRAFKEQIENASEVWQLRVDLARSVFISNARLNDEQVIKFDVLMDAMNVRLANEIENFSKEIISKNTPPSSENGIRLASGITKAMVLTYDEMDRSLSPDWRQKAGKDFELVNFVDPSVAMPLVDIEDKLPQAGPKPAPEPAP